MSHAGVRGPLAGGALLVGVTEAYSCAVAAAILGGRRGDVRGLAREAALTFVLEGNGCNIEALMERSRVALTERIRGMCRAFSGVDWRSALPNSLAMADALMDEVVNAYRHVYPLVLDGYFRLLDKGLTGVGSGVFKAVFEVGLQVDWMLGLPYYPGSTLKGAVRSAAEALLGEEAAEALFGRAGVEGHVSLVSFADSYPVGCAGGDVHPCLVLTGDVVSPHYFRPGKGLVESELDAEPTPVVHAAIAPGTVFRVVAGIRLLDDAELAPLIARAVEKRLLPPSARPNVEGVGLLVSRLVGAALLTGFAARSGKGYNILEHIPRENVANIVGRAVTRLRVYVEQRVEHRRGRERRGEARRRGAGGRPPRGRGAGGGRRRT